MFRFIGGLFRWSVIAGLVLVASVAVIGTNRIKSAYLSVRDHVRSNVDELVDTRVVLTEEIRELRRVYPKRIAELRCQLRDVERDLSACEADRQLCREVVTLCDSDVAVLQAKLDAADTDADGHGPAGVRFRSERLGRDEALDRAARIAGTAETYRARLIDLDDETALLQRERGLLRAELGETEREFREFQAQASSMLREIDSLKRKEKLVDMAESRAGERRSDFSARAGELSALKEKIERRKIQLDERLAAFRKARPEGEYEARARLRLAKNR